MSNPKWATRDRQALLVKLFQESGGFCVFGHRPCHASEQHHYEPYADRLIRDWVADDRAQTAAEWRAERRRLHGLGERPYTGRGPWSAIGKDVFYGGQPTFYVEAFGVTAMEFHPYARVRLASSWTRLHVDLSDCLAGMSKNKRRKAVRYGKSSETIHQAIERAVRDYLR